CSTPLSSVRRRWPGRMLLPATMRWPLPVTWPSGATAVTTPVVGWALAVSCAMALGSVAADMAAASHQSLEIGGVMDRDSWESVGRGVGVGPASEAVGRG